MLNTTFGDSITAGSGASHSSKSWVGLLTPQNRAVAGDMAVELSNVLHGYYYPTPGTPVVVDPTKTYSVMIGANDTYTYKSDAAKQEYFRQFLRASLAYLAFPQRVLGKDPAMSVTGAWSVFAINRHTASLNATAQCTVSGDAVYVAFQRTSNSPSSATVEIRIDGVLVDTVTPFAPGMGSAKGSIFGFGAKRYGGLSVGTHTVNLKVTSSGQNFWIGWVAGNDQIATPKIMASNIIKMSAAYYTGKGISVAVTDQYNAIIEDVIEELNGDGANIVLVDNYASIDPTVDLTADGIHPNDAGHAKISSNFGDLL